jgi:hypothetical protein
MVRNRLLRCLWSSVAISVCSVNRFIILATTSLKFLMGRMLNRIGSDAVCVLLNGILKGGRGGERERASVCPRPTLSALCRFLYSKVHEFAAMPLTHCFKIPASAGIQNGRVCVIQSGSACKTLSKSLSLKTHTT